MANASNLSCMDIYARFQVPTLNKPEINGILAMYTSGVSLTCAACFCAPKNVSVLQLIGAGFGMFFSSFCFGWYSGCNVGLQMF